MFKKKEVIKQFTKEYEVRLISITKLEDEINEYHENGYELSQMTFYNVGSSHTCVFKKSR